MGEKRLAFVRTLCFVENGEDVLMLKGAPTKRLYANLYNGVGGHLEAGEDLLASVRREVREETGLELGDACLRAVVNVDEAGKPGVVLFVFTAPSDSRQLRSSREGKVSWVPRQRLMELDLVEDLRQLLPIVLDENASQWFGHLEYDGTGKLTSFRGRFGGAAL
jgi:8-oxo-dGTP diphosphatase